MFRMGLVLVWDNDLRDIWYWAGNITLGTGTYWSLEQKSEKKSIADPIEIDLGLCIPWQEEEHEGGRGASTPPTKSLVAARWSQKKVATRDTIMPS